MKRTDIRQKDVFISWTGKDRELKNQIVEYLTEHGIHCLESDHKCSGDFRQWSREAVSACNVFLLIMTENTLQSEFVPVEIEEFKKMDDFRNRIVPVISSFDLYKNDPWGLSDFASAVSLDGNVVASEDQLREILSKVEMLIINLLDNVYKEATKPDYMKLIPLCKTAKFSDTQYDFSNLYVYRTITEIDENKQILDAYSDPTDLCKSKDIIFISGAAGSGKSGYIDQVREATDSDTVTIALPCYKFVSAEENLFSMMYNEFVKFCGNRYFYTQEDFRSLLNNRHLLLVLDGMDEISTEAGTRKFLQKVEEYYKANENITLFFTSRNENDANLIAMNGKKVRRFVLEKLNEDDIRMLGSNLFLLFGAKEKNEEFYIRIKDLNDEIKANPLLLSQLAIVYEDSGKIPETVTGIYDAVSEITFAIDKNHELGEIPDNYREMVTTGIRQILTVFSQERYNLLSKGKNIEIHKIFSKILKDRYGDESKARAEFLVEYLHNRSILVDNEFYHKMFLEYFTAVHYYENSFDDYDEIENPDTIKELFDHYNDPYWSAVIELFLVKADSCIDEETTKELYFQILSYTISEYTLLFDVCRDLIRFKEQAQTEIVRDILIKSVTGVYPAYGPLFWYVPEYELYEIALLTLQKLQTEDYYAKALALVRDVCFIFSLNHTAKATTDKVDGNLLFAAAENQLTGIRKALCELFFTGKTDSEDGYDIYPRCFNVREAKSYMDVGCGVYDKMNTPFEDELCLYSHDSYTELNDEYIGIVFCPYNKAEIQNRLNKKSCKKLCGLILSPTEDKFLDYIAFNRTSVKIFYVPENITECDFDYKNYMPLIQNVAFDSETKKSIDPYLLLFSDFDFSRPENNHTISKFIYFKNFLHLFGTDKTYANMFKGCTCLKTAIISGEIKELALGIFSDCSNLSEVIINYGTEILDGSTFENCINLTKIDMPDSICKTGIGTFSGCSKLTKIKFSNGISELCLGFDDCDSLEEIIIPDSVTTISQYAFSSLKNLKKIIIPNSVTTIDIAVFSECTNLSEINLSENLTTISVGLFSGCKSLQMIEIPESVSEIRSKAFCGCTSLITINIPENVKTIWPDAFKDCSGLKEIRLHIRFSEILSEIGITESTEVVFYGSADDDPLIPYESFSPTEVDDEDDVDTESEVYAYDPNAEIIILPDNLQMIKPFEFQGRNKIKEIVLPDGLKKIGAKCFCDCENLEKINIPDSVENIMMRAFKNCKKLESIKLPDNLDMICFGTFNGCHNLKNIDIPDKVKAIGPCAFSFNFSLRKVKLPSFLELIDDLAFSDCFSLEEIIIPNTVKRIGKDAFAGCCGLKHIEISYNFKNDIERIFGNIDPSIIEFI